MPVGRMQVILTLGVVQKVNLINRYKLIFRFVTYLVLNFGAATFRQYNDVAELAEDVAVVYHS
jgi:hypothetical protein